MNLFPAKTEHPLPDEIKKRLTGGLLISLLVHAFILSLQFGLPGVGLPGLEVPWEKRRAETPPLSIQIADVAPAPLAQAPVAAPSDMSSAEPVTAVNVKTENVSSVPSPVPPLTATPPASAVPAIPPEQKASTTQGLQLLAAPVATVSVPAPEKKTLSKTAKAKKSVTRIPVAVSQASRPPRVVAVDVPDIITQNNFRNDTFSVAVRDPEESKKELTQNVEQRMFPDPVSQTVDEPAELPPAVISRFEPDVQQSERREEKILQATKELLQEKIPLPASAQQSVKLLEESSRKQVAEAVRADANAALALKQQQEAEQQQQRILQEAGKANVSTLAAMAQQRSDNLKLVDDSLRQQMQLEIAAREQQRKERQAAMLAARQQAEEREEELKRQQEEALRRQQMEMQIAQARNEALQERQKIEKMAEQQAQQQAQEAQQKAQQERLEKQRAEDARQQAAQAQQREREQAAIAAAKAAGASKSVNTNDYPISAGKAVGSSNAGKASTAGNSSSAAAATGNANATGSGDKTAAFVLPQSLLSSDLANRSREQARGLDLLRGAPPLPRADTEERPRRRSVLGSAEKDIQLRMYVDSWKQKIERNGNLNFSQTSRDKARGDPVVTVAIRSDGSVEEVTIHRSSGRDDLDQAVRNIVRINARYAAFPPNIAAQYDVIEVRRVWNFDEGLRLLEELR